MDPESLSQRARQLAASQGRYAWELHPRYWLRNRLVFFSTHGDVRYTRDNWFRNRFGFLFRGRGCRALRMWAPRAHCAWWWGVSWGAVVQPTRAAQLVFLIAPRSVIATMIGVHEARPIMADQCAGKGPGMVDWSNCRAHVGEGNSAGRRGYCPWCAWTIWVGYCFVCEGNMLCCGSPVR